MSRHGKGREWAMRVAIVTDSTANLSVERANELGVTVVPLQVIFGEQSFADGTEITAAEFYDKMAHSNVLPSTSQPSAGAFAAVFEHLLRDHDAVLAILLSSRLSGTLQAAHTARELTIGGGTSSGTITLYDSGMTDYALGVQVEAAVRMSAEGLAPDAICALLPAVRERTRAFIVLGSLDNLRRGGRIPRAAALMGSLLQIKPIITLRDGLVDVYDKVRTYRKALDSILNKLAREVAETGVSEVMIIHATSDEAVVEFRERVRATAPDAQIRVHSLSPVVGVHAGINSMGLIYVCDEKK